MQASFCSVVMIARVKRHVVDVLALRGAAATPDVPRVPDTVGPDHDEALAVGDAAPVRRGLPARARAAQWVVVDHHGDRRLARVSGRDVSEKRTGHPADGDRFALLSRCRRCGRRTLTRPARPTGARRGAACSAAARRTRRASRARGSRGTACAGRTRRAGATRFAGDTRDSRRTDRAAATSRPARAGLRPFPSTRHALLRHRHHPIRPSHRPRCRPCR